MKNVIEVINKYDKKSIRNLIAGLSYQTVSISMGLILPHLFITSLGSESNGLMSSVTQIFTCLGLLEAGVGTTTIQALYKPIANNDQESINQILSATNVYYRKTGLWYAISVLFLSFIYPFFVDSAISAITIRTVILLQGIGTVITYLFQAKYNLLLKANGKNYIITTISLVVLILRNFGKIIAIYSGYDLVAVQLIQLFTIIIEAIIILLYIKHNYPEVSVNVYPDFNAISQKNSVLIQSAAWMIFNHTDILVLTIFTRNLGLISVYSVYALIFETAQNVLNEIRGSFQYKIGGVAQQNEKALDDYFKNYSIKIIMLTFTAFTTVYLLSVPFIKLYTKGITDADYMMEMVPELFMVYKILYSIRLLNKQLIEANGHFRQTERIGIVESLSNLAISVILVQRLGIIGVLLGTIVSLIISVTMYFSYLNGVVRSAIKIQILMVSLSFPIIGVSMIVGFKRLLNVNGWLNLIFTAILIGAASLLSYGICMGLCNVLIHWKGKSNGSF